MVCLTQTVTAAPYSELGGERVLLMNDYLGEPGKITGQGYDSVYKFNDTEVEDPTYNLLPGTEFCFSNATERTWHLTDVRLGNVFDRTGYALGATHNYLPWKRIGAMQATNSLVQVRNQHDTGHISLMNRAGARVVSSRYDDGIGYIYFDAVNFSTNTANRLVLSVCTNVEAAVEENWETKEDYGSAAEVAVYAITNGVLATVTTNEVAELAMTAGGSTNNFYRIVLADRRWVNLRKPAYFKIERADLTYPSFTDGEQMAIIDNIVCSYPVPTVAVTPPGVYDPTLVGEETVGWPLALQNPDDELVLPHFGVDNWVPQAQVEYITNQVDLGAVSLTKLDFRYRWRYLNQTILGTAGSKTLSATPETAAQATLSGATLYLPQSQFDSEFTRIPVKIHKITLGNTSYETATVVQYLRITTQEGVYESERLNGDGGYDFNHDGNYDAADKLPDGSWKLAYEFTVPVPVRTETEYEITFLDQYKTPITAAPKMRVIDSTAYPDLAYAVKVRRQDLDKSGYNQAYNQLMAEVECDYYGDFETLAMATDSLSGTAALPAQYTANPGDLEFYYTAEIDTPYYAFVDYAGAGVNWRAADAEKPDTIECRYRHPDLPSCGSDYFTRLRDGRTELVSFNIEYCSVKTTDDRKVCEHAALIGDNNWAALLPTPTNGACRVRARTVDANNRTNYLDFGSWEYESWPATVALGDTVHPADDVVWLDSGASWKTIEYEGYTGYLRFRYIEDTGVIVISRADYQNFDGWNDANKYNREVFVGTANATNEQSGTTGGSGTTVGVSGRQRTYNEDFALWKATSSTNGTYWSQNFSTLPYGVEPYTDVSKANQYGWELANIQYVNRKYNDDSSGYAVQLAGAGEGSVNFAVESEAPRGLENVDYVARIAQTRDFDNFAVYYSGESAINSGSGNKGLTNYTFAVRARMGNADTDPHDGQASLSLVGHYNSHIGCYEFRVTQTGAGNNYTYELYRWRKQNRKMVATRLGSFNINTGSLDANKNNSAYAPAMFLSVENYIAPGNKPAVCVLAGIQKGSNNFSYRDNMSGRDYGMLIYNDISDERLEFGSFGVTSMNCPGVFFRPTFYTRPVGGYSWLTEAKEKRLGEVNGFSQAKNITFAGNPVSLYTSLLQDPDGWDEGSWMEKFATGEFVPGVSQYWGLKCGEVGQDIILSVKADTSGAGSYEPVATNRVTGFALSSGRFAVHTREKCFLQLGVGGADDPIQTDVVLGGCEFSAWSGSDYNSTDMDAQTCFKDQDSGSPTNIVFTSAWVHDGDGEYGKAVELNASRSPTNRVVSIRSPLMDGFDSAYGIGLGMVAFSYTNCNEHVNLLVQIATNTATTVRSKLVDLTASPDDARWQTITNFSASAVATAKQGLPLKSSGVASCYVGMHAAKGMIRVIMDPEVVAESLEADDPAYGRIFVREVVFRDEPSIDLSCWWGWNMRTGSFLHQPDDGLMQYLADGSPVALSQYGMSGALNNSVTDKILEEEAELYNRHLPFIQTPTFPTDDPDNNITNCPAVGELSFKARRYDSEEGVKAVLSLYGAADGNAADDQWRFITKFELENSVYTNFTCTRVANNYKAYRLAVAGVKKQNGAEITMRSHEAGEDPVVRVAVDNIYVVETIQPKLQFKNVIAVRSNLDDVDHPVTDESKFKSEQPLLGEDFGIQVELEPLQLKEEIDYNSLKVKLYWKLGDYPWGYANWESAPDDAGELSLCRDFAESEGRYIFRSCRNDDAASIIAAPEAKRYDYVQYMLKLSFKTVDHSGGTEEVAEQEQLLSLSEWQRPDWYNGLGPKTPFAAYTILDNIAPGWAWINEVNLLDQYHANLNRADTTNQFVEVAMPESATPDVNLSGWKLRFISPSFDSYRTNEVRLATDNGIKVYKTKNFAQGMVFLVVGSPAMKADPEYTEEDGKFDGSWGNWSTTSSTFKDKGLVNINNGPVGIQLIRKNGIIEHQVVCGGTNTVDASWGEAYRQQYEPATQASYHNARVDGAVTLPTWYAAGKDEIEKDDNGRYSLSVLSGNGATTADWYNNVKLTPGEINIGQTIDGTPPAPAGNYVIVSAQIDDASKPILSQFDPRTGEFTTDNVPISVRKNSEGTNIVYCLKPFHELAQVMADNGAIPLPAIKAGTNVNVTVGVDIETKCTVTASAQVMEALHQWPYSLDKASPYYNAVLDWLQNGRTLTGSFDNPDPESIDDLKIAKFVPYSGYAPAITNLTLTEMYWLDIDPTSTNGQWWLRAGLVGYVPGTITANNDLTVYMCISNDATFAAYAPYTLRDRNGQSSQELANAGNLPAWNGPYFQITAWVQNNLPKNLGFLPVDWYVFGGNGGVSSSFNSDFTTTISVLDPRSPLSPGVYHGFNNFPGTDTYFKWRLDELKEIQNAGAKMLEAN